MPLFFILFVIIPVSEIALLIKVGGIIGAGYTVLLIFFTALVGATLLRKQGISTLMRAHQKLNSGEIPAKELFEGFLLALGGAFLLTPGFITDVFGFMLVIPPIRQIFVSYLAKRMVVHSFGEGPGMQSRTFTYGSQGAADPFAGRGRHGAGEEIIEGEYQDITPADRASGDEGTKKNLPES